MILQVDSGKTDLIILRCASAHLRNKLMEICRLVVLWVQVTTYPHTHKLYISTYTWGVSVPSKNVGMGSVRAFQKRLEIFLKDIGDFFES